ncbi:MAG TPA: TlpA disulfide reductase family protein [Byssovorax sp.]|jgi:thiol-disulfide isomerase/thioredoxin
MVRAAGLLVVALALLGCDEKNDGSTIPRDRSNAVTASPEPAGASAAPTAKAKAAAPRKQLCAGATQRPAPKQSPRAVAAEGASAPPVPVPFGVGKWVWVNLWAAWCAPCKEEMPRVLAWQKRLAERGVSIDVAWVSLDDDERQLDRFLSQQPKDAVRASYWLPEGDVRAAFTRELGLKASPELPVQALVAPSGQTSCVIEGAVEDSDWPALATFLGAKP